MDKNLSLIGICSGWGASNMGTAYGPIRLCDYFQVDPPFPSDIKYEMRVLEFHDWENFNPFYTLSGEGKSIRLSKVIHAISVTAQEVLTTLQSCKFPIVIGGDHSLAIGTWSAVRKWLKEDFGLIWIDAHLDANTYETTPSNAVHGMPSAALLGYGIPELTHFLESNPKISPENIAFIGIRSYEEGEANLLNTLGVKIFDMDYVHKHSFAAAFEAAHQWVTRNTPFYGISLDIDSFDPLEAPGTGTPEAHGLKGNECLKTFQSKLFDPNLIAFEIMEFNPLLDPDKKTEKLIWNMMKQLSRRTS
jgi:arginase